MTNKTEAPERIWAAECRATNSTMWWPDDAGGTGTEYIRADLSDAQAARIAEYEVRLRELETKLQAVATERDQLSDAFVNLQSDFEAAEAKLAKAVDAFTRIADLTSHNMPMSARDEQCVNREARATLADLQKPIATRDDPA